MLISLLIISSPPLLPAAFLSNGRKQHLSLLSTYPASLLSFLFKNPYLQLLPTNSSHHLTIHTYLTSHHTSHPIPHHTHNTSETFSPQNSRRLEGGQWRETLSSFHFCTLPTTPTAFYILALYYQFISYQKKTKSMVSLGRSVEEKNSSCPSQPP